MSKKTAIEREALRNYRDTIKQSTQELAYNCQQRITEIYQVDCDAKNAYKRMGQLSDRLSADPAADVGGELNKCLMDRSVLVTAVNAFQDSILSKTNHIRDMTSEVEFKIGQAFNKLNVGITAKTVTDPSRTVEEAFELKSKPEKKKKKKTRREAADNSVADQLNIQGASAVAAAVRRKKRSVTAFIHGDPGRQRNTRRQAKVPANDPPVELYCFCNKPANGRMVACDNDKCVIEWFHFDCMSIVTSPKGKWFCPTCRGDSDSHRKP